MPSLLANRDFVRLWIAQSVSAVGSRFTRTALPILAIETLRASSLEIGLLSSLGVAPAFLVGLLASGWVDRSRKVPILIGADVLRAFLVLSIPLASWGGVLTMGQLYVVAALGAALSSVFRTADSAFLPAVVGNDHIIEGNARFQATESLAEVTGPALAGVLVQTISAPLAMVVDGLSFLWSASWIGQISGARGSIEQLDEAPPSILHGVRLCLAHALVRPLFVSHAIRTFASGFFFALYMLYVLEVLSLGPAAVGIIIGVGGIGGLVGAGLARPLLRRFGIGPTMIGCFVLGQLAMLFIPLAAAVPSRKIELLVLHQLVSDGALVAFVVLATSLRQRSIPLDNLGQAHGAFEALEAAMLTLGAIAAGALGELVGVERSFWVGVTAGLMAPLPLLISPIRNAR